MIDTDWQLTGNNGVVVVIQQVMIVVRCFIVRGTLIHLGFDDGLAEVETGRHWDDQEIIIFTQTLVLLRGVVDLCKKKKNPGLKMAAYRTLLEANMKYE